MSRVIDVERIMRYEEGDLQGAEVVELFGELIRSGDAWRLQGHYGRTASRLIESGIMDRDGNVDWGVFRTLVGEE